MIISSVVCSAINRRNIQQRIMACMGISDFVLPFMRLTGFLWIPSSHPGSFGNEITCDVQGFLIVTTFIATTAYNAVLALYYLLIIRFNWQPSRLKSIEKWLYIVPLLIGLFFASLAVGFNVVNPPGNVHITNVCTVQVRYLDFYLDYDETNEEISNIIISVLWIIFPTTYLLIIVFNIICIITVYFHVRKTEMRSMKASLRNTL